MLDVEVLFLIFSEISSVGEKHKCFCKATNVFVNAFISSTFVAYLQTITIQLKSFAITLTEHYILRGGRLWPVARHALRMQISRPFHCGCKPLLNLPVIT